MNWFNRGCVETLYNFGNNPYYLMSVFDYIIIPYALIYCYIKFRSV